MSPFKNTDGCHSWEVIVFEATYLVDVLTAGHISLCCGQCAAQISENGTVINGERVVERANLATKELRFVTEKSGLDNNKKALFRYTYMISGTNFSIKKEVRYEGAQEFIERNQYVWKR